MDPGIQQLIAEIKVEIALFLFYTLGCGYVESIGVLSASNMLKSRFPAIPAYGRY
jgi:hypothetical protein